jgi:peptidoglycan/LPS O-acetylase OafA/YrhL
VLDGWRGLAILVVVLHNAGAISYSLEGPRSLPIVLFDTVLSTGWVGVQLFFVLSGFLITGILVDTVGAPGYFRSFYLRRTIRIFPVYYACLLIVFVVIPLLWPEARWMEGPRSDQIWYWLYLSNWRPLLEHPPGAMSHLWSLGIEEQFYLLWPLVVLLSGRKLPWVVLLVVVASPMSRFWMLARGMDVDSLYYFTNARADALAIGGLLALAIRRPSWWAALSKSRPWLLAITSAALAAVMLVTRGFHQDNATVLAVGQSVIAIWFAVLMAWSLDPVGSIEQRAARALEHPWLKSLGKYSYAVYVIHVPLSQPTVPHLVERIGPTSTAAYITISLGYALLILAASVVLAKVSWLAMEEPLNRLKDRISPRPTSR